MWIMISGPYRSGSTDPEIWKRNLELMNKVAHIVLQKGHTPVIGVNMALPVIAGAGEKHYNEIMMPISMALAERCDAVLRIGGTSANADREVALFRQRGLPVYYTPDEIPTTQQQEGRGS